MRLNNYTFILSLSIAVLSTFTVSAQYISRFAGNGVGAGTATGSFSGDGGAATFAGLNAPSGVAFDGAGNVYIADKGNNVVRKVNTAGVITTFAGTGTAGYSGNGGPAILAKLSAPSAVATDAAGNVYISDNGNHTVRVVNPAGVIRNFAGNGTGGYSGNGDTAHLGMLNDPQGIAFDAAGNMYIADAGNQVIRKVAATTHIISTIAGSGVTGYSGDAGPATLAKLFTPGGVAVDATGNIYIADILNNVVRKVSTSGIITTFAGNGTSGNSGNGGAATAAAMRYPASVSVDISGNVYIADQGNNNIRMVNTSGIITHIAGTSANGYEGDGGFAVAAKLGSPKCVTADGWGRVYIADYANHVVRVISSSANVNLVNNGKVFNIYPNPSIGVFTLSIPGLSGTANVAVANLTGTIAAAATVTPATQNQPLNFNTLAPGVYTLHVTTADAKYSGKILIQK